MDPIRPRGPGALTIFTALAQGFVWLATGLWPFVSMDTFLAVTGPKTDLWLVRTVGALVAVVGATLLIAAVRRHLPLELRLLGIGGALALASVDVAYVANGTLSAVYLLDAVGEVLLAAGWVAGSLLAARRSRMVVSPVNGGRAR